METLIVAIDNNHARLNASVNTFHSVCRKLISKLLGNDVDIYEDIEGTYRIIFLDKDNDFKNIFDTQVIRMFLQR